MIWLAGIHLKETCMHAFQCPPEHSLLDILQVKDVRPLPWNIRPSARINKAHWLLICRSSFEDMLNKGPILPCCNRLCTFKCKTAAGKEALVALVGSRDQSPDIHLDSAGAPSGSTKALPRQDLKMQCRAQAGSCWTLLNGSRQEPSLQIHSDCKSHLKPLQNLNEISGTDGRIFIKAQQKQAAHQDSAIENAIENVGRSAGRRM